MAKGLPARGPDPSGRTEMRGRRSCKRFRSLMKKPQWDNRKCDQRIGWARYFHSSSARVSNISVKAAVYLQMSISRHDVVNFARSTCHGDLEEILHQAIECVDLLKQPDAHVCRDLVVAGTPSVQFS